MKPHSKVLTALIAMSILSSRALAQQLPVHQTGEAANGVVVELCDGVTKTAVKGLKPGQTMTHQQAIAVTHSLMAEWERKHPDQHWEMAQDTGAGESTDATTASPAASNAPEASPAQTEEPPVEEPSAAPTEAHTTVAPQNGKPVVSGPGHKQSPPLQQGDTYASFNERDMKVWQANTDRFVQEGKEVFHSADKLGGTIGVSCDMCHPDASNTHPETYPKYQVQLQRVALLRDMIEWCIENPVKGKTMGPNDPRLRALEAYILAQRKGVPLDYGKH
jgi:thiosulfate dehydrogenase